MIMCSMNCVRNWHELPLAINQRRDGFANGQSVLALCLQSCSISNVLPSFDSLGFRHRRQWRLMTDEVLAIDLSDLIFLWTSPLSHPDTMLIAMIHHRSKCLLH